MSEKVKKFFEKKSNKIICGVAAGVILLGAAGGITACALVKKNKNAKYALTRLDVYSKLEKNSEWVLTGYEEFKNNSKGLPLSEKIYGLDKENNPILNSEHIKDYDANGYLSFSDYKVFSNDGKIFNRIKLEYTNDSFGNETKRIVYDFKKDNITVTEMNEFFTEYTFDDLNRVIEKKEYTLNGTTKEYVNKYTYEYFKDTNRITNEKSYYFADEFVLEEEQRLTIADDGKLVKYEMFDETVFVKKTDFTYINSTTVKCVDSESEDGTKSDSEIIYTFRSEEDAKNIVFITDDIFYEIEGLTKKEVFQYDDFSKTSLQVHFVDSYSYDKHENVSSIEEEYHHYIGGELNQTNFYKEAYTYEKIK